MALVCCLCLHRGTDEDRVTIQSEYVGGIGETQASLCVDRTRCWERWNKAHEVKQGDEGVKAAGTGGATGHRNEVSRPDSGSEEIIYGKYTTNRSHLRDGS